MSTNPPIKMSQFEGISNLYTGSYLVGIGVNDDAQLINIRIPSDSASISLGKQRWVLPAVTSPSDTRGEDGSESYGTSGQYWIKTGGTWYQVNAGGGGGVISSSAQLTNGQGFAFNSTSNVTFGQVTASALLISGSGLRMTSGSIIIGRSTPEYIFGGQADLFQVLGTAATTGIIARYSNNPNGPRMGLLKSRSSTIGTGSAVQSGDTLGRFCWFADGGISGLVETSMITSENVAGDPIRSTINFWPGHGGVGMVKKMIVSEYGIETTGSFRHSGSLFLENPNSGRLVIGSDVSESIYNTDSLQVLGTGATIGFVARYSNNANGPRLGLVKSRSGTIGGRSAIQNGDNLGRLSWYADNGTNLVETSMIYAENVAGDAVQSVIKFWPGKGGTGMVQRMVISDSGTEITGSLNVQAGVTGSLLGTASYSTTASYALYARSNEYFNVKDYGAIGNGTTNDTIAIQSAIIAAQASRTGSVYFPDGTYIITGSLTLPTNPQADIALIGNGANTSVVKLTGNATAVSFSMDNGSTSDQPYQVQIRDLGIHAGTQISYPAIYVSYGTTSDSRHADRTVLIENVHIRSNQTDYWSGGIVLESAWNYSIDNTFMVGKETGSGFIGNGVEIRRLCINGTITNCQMNFWNRGIFVNSVDYSILGQNTEGMLMDKITMVPVTDGIVALGNSEFTGAPGGSLDFVDWQGRPIAARIALLTLVNSHIDSRDKGIPLKLKNVSQHFISNNLLINGVTSEACVKGENLYEGVLSGNMFFNPSGASIASLYLAGYNTTSASVNVYYSSSANIVTGNVFRGTGTSYVNLDSGSIYNKVYGNIGDNLLNISVVNNGTSNSVGTVGN